MFLLCGVIWAFASIAVAVLRCEPQEAPVFPHGEGNCRECAYSLHGLPADAPCPECGNTRPGAPTIVRRSGSVPSYVNGRLATTFSLSMLSLVLYGEMLHVALHWSFVLQFGAARATQIGSSRGMDIEWQDSLFPIAIGGVVAALSGLSAREERWLNPLLCLTALSWAVSVAWLFLRTWATFG